MQRKNEKTKSNSLTATGLSPANFFPLFKLIRYRCWCRRRHCRRSRCRRRQLRCRHWCWRRRRRSGISAHKIKLHRKIEENQASARGGFKIVQRLAFPRFVDASSLQRNQVLMAPKPNIFWPRDTWHSYSACCIQKWTYSAMDSDRREI